jgi:hypothetical protein
MSGTTAGVLGVEGTSTTRYMPPSESIRLKLLALAFNFFMFMGRDCERQMWTAAPGLG